MLNVFGPAAHLIQYPISSTHSSWALTQRQSAEEQESWSLATPEEISACKAKLLEQFGGWASPIPDIITGAERLVKYGIYDRPDLQAEQWYDGRCVLLGDAAHPTSPHLGQGANQAMYVDHKLPYYLTNTTDIFQGGLLSSSTTSTVGRSRSLNSGSS